ncbi:neurensin-1, partial [Biomphalaria glabrata]
MAEYAEGYPEPVDVSSSDGPAEENHEVGASKRGSKDADSKPKRKRSCPMYFGVKSYLHQFYEDHTFKDPSVYEDDDHQYLLQPHQRRRRCTPIWWK